MSSSLNQPGRNRNCVQLNVNGLPQEVEAFIDSMRSGTLTFVTGNANKLNEVREMLSSSEGTIEILAQAVNVPEIQGTTQEIASYKAVSAAKVVGGPCITEDTALCFEALGGLPGPYIKAFLDVLHHEGLNRLLSAFTTKRAYALCTFAYCAGPQDEPLLFEGRCEGSIVPARGLGTFGWDPIFEPTGTGQTFAEMSMAQKNAISHRSKALAKLRAFLQSST